jgi:hypothetical protein
MPQTKTATQTLREPPVLCASQLKRTTFRKSHFVRNFKGKMLEPRPVAQTLLEPAQSKCSWMFLKSLFFAEIYRKKSRALMEHPDQAPAFTP